MVGIVLDARVFGLGFWGFVKLERLQFGFLGDTGIWVWAWLGRGLGCHSQISKFIIHN